jgi:hypothetical protein
VDLKHTRIGWCFLILVNFLLPLTNKTFFEKSCTTVSNEKKRLKYYLTQWNSALTPLGWKPVPRGRFQDKTCFQWRNPCNNFWTLHSHTLTRLQVYLTRVKHFSAHHNANKVYESHTQLCIISVCQAQQQNATFNPVPLRGLNKRNWVCPLSSQCLVFSQFAETFCHFSVLVCFFVIRLGGHTPQILPWDSFSIWVGT